ncbi:MAG: hypothetical protein R6W48_09045 [Gaiellaceae bacterium]
MANHRVLRKGLVGVALIALALTGVTGALAAKPDKAPFEPEPIVLDAGLACDFDVRLSPEPGNNFTEKLFSDGRFVVTGSGADRLTNLDNGKSIVLHTSGQATFTEAGSEQAIEVQGHNVIYLFPGDEGPFGTVEEPGALYFFKGRVSEILDLNENIITSFTWSGHVTELCSAIS